MQPSVVPPVQVEGAAKMTKLAASRFSLPDNEVTDAKRMRRLVCDGLSALVGMLTCVSSTFVSLHCVHSFP